MLRVQLFSLDRVARVLALAALLLVTGLQLVEATHVHSADDNVSRCLQCKSPGSAALPQHSPTQALPAFAAVVFFIIPAPTSSAVAALPRVRGPPSLS